MLLREQLTESAAVLLAAMRSLQAAQLRNAAAVQQSITINVTDGSPAAIANAVSSAGERLALDAALEGV